MYDLIVPLFLFYIYIIPFLMFILVQWYVHIFKEKFLWFSLISFLSIIGIIFVTYAEAIYIDNNGLSGGESDWIKYFIWATVNYILMLRQLYLVRKKRNLKEK
jgi:hypothetical protein